MKRMICLFLMIFLLAFSVVPIYGSETRSLEKESIISPMFVHIHHIIPGLKIDSSGKATSLGVAGTYSSSHTINMNVELQKLSGSSWNTIKNWTASGPGYPSGVMLERDWYVVKGTYRVSVTVQVYDSFGRLLETQTASTSPRVY
ncbi:MAG: hypothetical protein GX958_11915 [Desulfitobacterium sp.]|nr:hypothetical protein [Desulfitobacterium sp.]